MTNLSQKYVCYNRVFVNNRVRYNRVSLYCQSRLSNQCHFFGQNEASIICLCFWSHNKTVYISVFQQLFKLKIRTTVKLGYNELGCYLTLGYNKQIFRVKWSFYYTNWPGYNEQKWPVPRCSLQPSLTVCISNFQRICKKN